MPWTTTTPKLIIFTDLDETLLDRETYSFEEAQPTLQQIKRREVPLVLSSSKTRAEIEFYRRKLKNTHPFISENGGAVFIPKGYFSFEFPYNRELEEYFVLELGTYYLEILEVLEVIKKETGIFIKGFSDLSEREISFLCGLDLREAELAKRREYDEPFMVEGGQKEVEILKQKIKEKEMNYIWGGRFHHILGKNDKGKAVEILRELYENQFFSIATVGIGDSASDFPMLFSVDHPIFLKGEGLPLPEQLLLNKKLKVIDGKGAKAWNEAVLEILDKFYH